MGQNSGSMSEVSPMLDEFKWASPEERLLAEKDAVLYGNCFVKRGEDGLMRRIDPATIKAMDA